MQKHILILILLLLSSSLKTLSLPKEPDFAYPQTTLQNALKSYDRAIVSPTDSSESIVRSVLEMSIATAAISRDSVVTVLPRIDKAITLTHKDTKVLLYLIKAEVLNNIYNFARYKYDRTDTPDEPLPRDVMEWNGRQFRAKITALCDSAFDIAASSADRSLSSYTNVIKTDRLSLQFFPDIMSLTALKCLSLAYDYTDSKKESIINGMAKRSRKYSDAWFYWVCRSYDISDRDKRALLKDLFLSCPDQEGAGYVLSQYIDCSYDVDAWFIPALKKFIDSFPEYWDINALKNNLARLTMPKGAVSCKNVTAPMTDFEIKLSQSFSTHYGFNIYKISPESFKRHKPISKSDKLVEQYSIFNRPFAEHSDSTVHVKLPAQGYYVIIPTVNGKVQPYTEGYIQCIPFIPNFMHRSSCQAIITSDYIDGKPVKGLNVSQHTPSGTRKLGSTDANGIVFFEKYADNQSSKGYQTSYDIQCNGENFRFFNEYVSPSHRRSNNRSTTFMTDRALYHPGDTVNWLAITYTNKDNNTVIESRAKLCVQLRNTNGDTVDSLYCQSDDMGRVYASFVTPVSGLTGRYTLVALSSDKTIAYGNRLIEVSDFRLPEIRLSDIKVARDTPRRGYVTLSADITTYTGMPVSDAKISAEIWEATRWRLFSPSRIIGRIDTVAAADGKINIIVPDSILRKSDTKSFIAKLDAVAPSGEHCFGSKSFTEGKPLVLEYAAATTIFDIDLPLKGLFAAYNASGDTASIDIRWWITPSDGNHSMSEAVVSGITRTTADAEIDLTNLNAGTWVISAAPVDTALADANIDMAALTLYGLKSGKVPPQSILFAPLHDIITDRKGHFSVDIATPCDSIYLYKALGSETELLSLDVTRISKGFHRIGLRLPDGKDDANVIFFTVKDGMTVSEEINIRRAGDSALILEGSSMRDKLTPGKKERWHLKLRDAAGRPQRSALAATMYNAAMDKLARYAMPGIYRFDGTRTTLSLFTPITRQLWPIESSLSPSMLQTATLGVPDFKPSLRLVTFKHLMIRGTKQMNAKSAASGEAVIEDYATFDTVTTEDEEAIAVDDGGLSDTYASDDIVYRDGETLQALWMPDMTFDDNGDAWIDFTMPNATGSWSFNAFAWTKDARTASMTRELICARPVMVKPLLPRFLRSGDRARINATVYNATDSAATVTSCIEIFELNNGAVLHSVTATDTIAAGNSAIVAIDVAAPYNYDVLGYRVKSTLGGFTDGEQDYIPILPSSTELIESQPFYMNPGETECNIDIPSGLNTSSVLEITENPAWNILRELPGLASRQSGTAIGAVHDYFRAATCAGLLDRYPVLAEAIETWITNPMDSTLISRLSTNDIYKQAALDATPWVRAAEGATSSMNRLGLLLAPHEVKRSLSNSFDTLKKLQCSDGGWKWGEWCSKSSPWITASMLITLGRLNEMGYLPADKGLKDMITKAFTYYEKSLNVKTETDLQLTRIAALWPDLKPNIRGRRIIDATLQKIIGGWKQATVVDKALYASILKANGYKRVAQEIMKSVAEFAVVTKSQGVSFPSVNDIDGYATILYALSKIDPQSAIIDGVRQWLTIRQQTTQRLGSCDPTLLVAAFASTGSPWLSLKDSKTTVSDEQTVFDIPCNENVTGHAIVKLPTPFYGKTVTIRSGNSTQPTYGAVMTKSDKAITNIAASSCQDLSVEKRIMALRNGKWKYSDEVAAGERVRTVYTIKVKRDLQYVTLVDKRAAALEPVNQIPEWTYSAGCGFYIENRDTATNLFVDYLPKGTYSITVEMTAMAEGEYISGPATVQSQLAPSISAHSTGGMLRVVQAK